MNGPPLTVAETAQLLARQVDRLVPLGVARQPAIEAVAKRHGIEPAVVDRLIAPLERQPPSDRAAA